jgi:iron complex outermembrane receptor protein
MKPFTAKLSYHMNLHCSVRLLYLFCLICFGQSLSAQYYILGRGLDDAEKPYAHATAELRGKDYSSQQTCTEQGVFRFENLKSGSYELVLITAYGIRRKKIDLKGSIDITLHIPRNIKIDEISVVASKAGEKEPVTHENVNATELKQKDFALDMPYLLEGTPSLVATSDAGHGIGYSGLRIRGTDPTRINVTLNGIPINDAESHNVFWVDLPDLASSTTTIQVQRGLGWSQPGVGDLGGGIHINTLGFKYEPYGSLKLSGGSFDTRRITLAGGSGLINGRFTLDGRASYISSGGYIDRADNTLYSLYGSAGYHHDETNIRFVYALGDELTYQAWNGVPEQYINDPVLRTYNTAGTEKPGEPYDNEVDDYRQSHMQFHFDQAITPFMRFNTALHYTKGSGFFEQYKANQPLVDYGITGFDDTTDLVRQLWLDNDYYGFISTLHIGSPGERYFVAGGGWNRYDGDHFGKITWTASEAPDSYPSPYYLNNGLKTDWNLFARSNNKINERFDITFDLQGRWIKYDFEGPDQQGQLVDQHVSLKFFNPKIGFSYDLGETSSIYGLTGVVNKEPNRDDYTQSTPDSRPDPERLWDTEIGLRHQEDIWNVEIVGYAMQYKDHLVPTGRLNDVGAYTRVNVDESYRIGTEVMIGVNPLKNLEVGIQATLSSNKIKSFTEYIDRWFTDFQETVEHENTDLAFSPAVLAAFNAGYTLLSNVKHELVVDFHSRYVGKQYADNTSREASSIDPYFVSDAGVRWTMFNAVGKEIHVGLLVRNLFNEAYESNAWIYRFHSEGYDPVPDDPYSGSEGGDLYHQKGYFPQAGTYFMINMGIDF